MHSAQLKSQRGKSNSTEGRATDQLTDCPTNQPTNQQGHSTV